MSMKQSLGLRASAVLVFSVTALASAAFVTWFVGQERYLYFWDFVQYHWLHEDFGVKLRGSPVWALGSLIYSIGQYEYNLLPVVLLSPFHLLFGDGRLAYILAVTLVYGISAIVLFSVLVGRISRDALSGIEQVGATWALLVPVVVLTLLPQFWVPVLAGYVDVAGLGVVFLILILYLRQDPLSIGYRRAVAIGLLLCLLIALRRWYAYWVVGFLVAAGVRAAWHAWRSAQSGTASPLRAVKYVIVMGFTGAAAFFVIAHSLALRMLTTNYADVYSAYRTSETRLEQLQQLYGHFGLLTLSMAALGAALALADKRLRAIAAFLLLQFIVSYALFSRVQDMSVQHFYLVLATVAIFSTLFALCVLVRLHKPQFRAAWLLLVASIGLANFLSVLYPPAEALRDKAGALLPAITSYPKTRNDLHEVHRLLTVLNELTQPSGARVYVLSSSHTLNSHMLARASAVAGPPLHELRQRIFHTHDVDKRDGFPVQLLEASYVVVTDPIGYHLAPKDQMVIGAIATQLLEQRGAGRAFEKLAWEFTLDRGEKVYLYRKRRPFEIAELDELEQIFLRRYPDRVAQFTIDPMRKRKATDAAPAQH